MIVVKYFYRILSFILLIIWALNMFSLSSENAEVSTETGDGVSVTLIKIFYPRYNTLNAEEQKEIITAVRPYVRTGAHFTEYAVLGFLFSLFLVTFYLKRRSKLILSEAFCVVFALSDEIHQLFSPGRAFQFSDLLTDSLGAAAGLLIFLLLVHPKVKYDK